MNTTQEPGRLIYLRLADCGAYQHPPVFSNDIKLEWID